MAICSFLGTTMVLGDTLYPRLCNVLERLVDIDDHMEVLLTPCNEPFFNVCLKVALEIKSRHIDKVMITLLIKREDDQSENKWDVLPACMVDRICVAGVPVMKGKSANISEKYNLQRRAIKASTHVICCLYEKLFDRENELLTYAKKRSGLELIDVSDKEIEEAIEFQTPLLMREREHFVREKLSAGFAYREIGEMMGISLERARQIDERAGTRIRRFAYDSFRNDFVVGKQYERPVCALFSLDDPSPQKIEMLKETVITLIERFRIGSCEISARCYNSPFLQTLTKLGWRYHH